MFDRFREAPALVRILPFAVFIGLTFFQDSFGEAGRYWVYLLKTVAGAATLFICFRHIPELKLVFSVPALIAGIGVFAFWVGLDGLYPKLNDLYPRFICPLLAKLGMVNECAGSTAARPWNPNTTFGSGSTLAFFFIVVRIAGSSLLVPVIEEIFWRSFVYRYIAARDFAREPLNRFHPLAFLLTSLLFGLEHQEWLAGILCGFVYQGLVLWKNRLGDAVAGHIITNFLLGLWVVWKSQWQFW